MNKRIKKKYIYILKKMQKTFGIYHSGGVCSWPRSMFQGVRDMNIYINIQCIHFLLNVSFYIIKVMLEGCSFYYTCFSNGAKLYVPILNC